MKEKGNDTMDDLKKTGTGFVGYEYQDVTVKRSMASLYADGYENFGWKLEATAASPGKPESVTMKLKRNRKLPNKPELTRLQRQFDACASEIQSLEFSKYVKGSVVAYGVGLLGTALMAGSVFAVTAGSVIGCIVLAVPAFVGWVAPYLLYRSITAKTADAMNPLIDQKHDEIYDVCQKASLLLEQ